MDERMRENLEGAGINVEDALERFMGNEGLLVRFLKKFLDDGNFAKLSQAVEEQNYNEALTASHTLKGVCGNLSIGTLYELADQQVKLFRQGKAREAADMMPQMRGEYEKICGTLRRELAG